jgi:hypothetical protein
MEIRYAHMQGGQDREYLLGKTFLKLKVSVKGFLGQ